MNHHSLLQYLLHNGGRRINAIGRLPLCNLRAERSPRLGKYCFVLCWRCTSLSVGIIVSQAISLNIPKYVAIIAIAICGIDGVLQYAFKIESNNYRRSVTGFIAGAGIGCVIVNNIRLM